MERELQVNHWLKSLLNTTVELNAVLMPTVEAEEVWTHLGQKAEVYCFTAERLLPCSLFGSQSTCSCLWIFCRQDFRKAFRKQFRLSQRATIISSNEGDAKSVHHIMEMHYILWNSRKISPFSLESKHVYTHCCILFYLYSFFFCIHWWVLNLVSEVAPQQLSHPSRLPA